MSTETITKITGPYCPLSGEPGTVIGTKDGVDLREGAGTLLAWAWNSEEEYQSLYTDSARYHEGEQIAGGQRTFWERDSDRMHADASRLRIMSSLFGPLKGRRLLDVGAGTGMFASMAREIHGMDAHGLEPNAGMVAQGKMLGRPVHEGVAEFGKYHGGHDFITMHDVFEHLTRPNEALSYIRTNLEMGGVAIIEMPEWGSPDQIKAGLDWKHIRPRQHVCLYSKAAAEAMFDRHGFEVVAFHRPLNGSLGKMAHYLTKKV